MTDTPPVPAELVRMLNKDAGKHHSATGPVMVSLARILARHEQMVREQVASVLKQEAHRAAVCDVDGPGCVEAVTWMRAAGVVRDGRSPMADAPTALA